MSTRSRDPARSRARRGHRTAWWAALALLATSPVGAQEIPQTFDWHEGIPVPGTTPWGQAVDDSKRGRVMSLFQVCWAGLLPFGGLGMGFTADAIGVVPTLELASSVSVVFGVGVALRYWWR